MTMFTPKVHRPILYYTQHPKIHTGLHFYMYHDNILNTNQRCKIQHYFPIDVHSTQVNECYYVDIVCRNQSALLAECQ